MKKLLLQKGFAQIPLVLGLLFLAIATPLSVRLVQQNQDKRSSAANDGSCYVPKLNQRVTDGSFVCTDGGVGKYSMVSKCSYGSLINQSNCGLLTNCIYTSKKENSNGILTTDAVCRTDDKCKNKKGTCSAPNSAKNGDSCTTSDGKNGKVEGNLCFGTLDKKCCIPSETSSSGCKYKDGYKANGTYSCGESTVLLSIIAPLSEKMKTNTLYKCNNGTWSVVKSCGEDGCVNIDSSKASCRTDKGCTDLGGACVVSASTAVGSSCQINGKTGTVKANLCLGRSTFDKKCCVPSSNNNQPTPSQKKNTGSSCTSAGECPSNKCVGGKCIGWDSECNSFGGPTGCASGSCVLAATIDNGKTKVYKCNNKGAGATCYYNKECASGKCDSTHKCIAGSSCTIGTENCTCRTNIGTPVSPCNSGLSCQNNKCVRQIDTSGKGSGAEKCLAKGGACQTNGGKMPSLGSSCTISGKSGKYQPYLCLGQYGSTYRCCVPN